MADVAPLADAGRRAAKEQFKRWLEANMADPAAMIFMLDQFDLAYDLIITSIERGGMPTKADVVRYIGGKGISLAGFSDDNRVACISSVVSLGLTASAAPAAGVAPPAWVFFTGAVLLDMLDVGGNCRLAYLDAKLESDIKKMQALMDARRAHRNASALCRSPDGQSLATSLDLILNPKASPLRR